VLALAVRNTTRAFLGSSYGAAGLELFGLGPGLTVPMGLPPPTPSAMAVRMSTSTTILVPNDLHVHSIHDALLSLASTLLKVGQSGHTRLASVPRAA
jgi:hypothetical protein